MNKSNFNDGFLVERLFIKQTGNVSQSPYQINNVDINF